MAPIEGNPIVITAYVRHVAATARSTVVSCWSLIYLGALLVLLFAQQHKPRLPKPRLPRPRAPRWPIALYRQVRRVRAYVYKGRHRQRPVEPGATVEFGDELHQWNNGQDPAPLCPPMYPAYDHHLGVGRYAHLRDAELEATAERALRLAEFHERRHRVDLEKLKVRSPYGTPELIDEWVSV